MQLAKVGVQVKVGYESVEVALPGEGALQLSGIQFLKRFGEPDAEGLEYPDTV